MFSGEDDYGNDDFAMDNEYEESAPVNKEDKKKQKKLMEQQELSKMLGKRRKRRKKSAFHDAIEAEKPVFDPKDIDYSEFLDVSQIFTSLVTGMPKTWSFIF